MSVSINSTLILNRYNLEYDQKIIAELNVIEAKSDSCQRQVLFGRCMSQHHIDLLMMAPHD